MARRHLCIPNGRIINHMCAHVRAMRTSGLHWMRYETRLWSCDRVPGSALGRPTVQRIRFLQLFAWFASFGWSCVNSNTFSWRTYYIRPARRERYAMLTLNWFASFTPTCTFECAGEFMGTASSGVSRVRRFARRISFLHYVLASRVEQFYVLGYSITCTILHCWRFKYMWQWFVMKWINYFALIVFNKQNRNW